MIHMNNNILTSIKKLLGIDAAYSHFDIDIMIHINSVFLVLYQLGIGPSDKPFSLYDGSETWEDFFKMDPASTPIELVKSYIYLKVRLLFDPPTTGVLHEAMERQIKEYEWRLNVQAETPAYSEEEGGGTDESDDEECSCGCGRLY